MDELKRYVMQGDLEKVESAVRDGDLNFDINWIDYDLLKTALVYKHKPIAIFLIHNNFRLNKNIYSERDNTPLHLAVTLGWKDVVELLLRMGASTEVRENTNYLTPIELSFLTEKYELTDLMLQYYKKGNFDVVDRLSGNITDKLGDNFISIIHIATARNFKNIVRDAIQNKKHINSPIRYDYFNWPGYTPLHFAVKFKSKDTLELLLKCGAEFTAQDANKNTPLHLAGILQDESSIDLILSHHKYMGKNPKNSNNLSHLHIACTRNDPKIVYGLIQCGANPNDQVSDSSQIFKKFTALHCAVVYQCTDVIRLLLAHGSNKNINLNRFLLDVHKTKNSELIDLILTNTRVTSPYIESGNNISPFFKACMQLEDKKIQQLIESGASINERLPPDAPIYPGCTALHIAVSYRRISTIRLLLRNGADTTIADARGKTPLHFAFAIRYFKAVVYFFYRLSKWEENPVDEDGLSYFHIACAIFFEDSEKIIDRFIEAGVNVNATVSNNSLLYSGYTPLHMAISHSNFLSAIKLLDHSANVTIKDSRELTAFDYLFKPDTSVNQSDFTENQIDFIETVLEHEEIVDCFTRYGFTRLHIACIVDDTFMALHSFGDSDVNAMIDLNSRVYPGYRPLHFATTSGNSDMCTLLLDHGADPLARTLMGDTPLHLWSWDDDDQRNQQSSYDRRLFSIEENPFGQGGYSHFHMACGLQLFDVIMRYLDEGIDVDIRTMYADDMWDKFPPNCNIGGTALHIAAEINDLELVEMLLGVGADVNAQDIINQTPLHVCTENFMMVFLLLENGANMNAEKCDGFTPLQITVIPLAGIEYKPDENIPREMSPFGFYDEDEHVSKFIGSYWVFLQHVLRLRAEDFYVNDANMSLCSLEKQNQYGFAELATEYKERCYEELEHMAGVQIDRNTTLRDVLHKSPHHMRYLVVNETFQNVLESAEMPHGRSYPIYWWLIKLQNKIGLKRRTLIARALFLLNKLNLLNLPDVCYEEILRYFNEKELVELIKKLEQC